MGSTHKPTVLVFTDWYIPGYKAGGPISSIANMVAALGLLIHFKIVCSDRDYLDTKPYHDVEPFAWQKVGLAEVLYLPLGKVKLRDIRSIIDRTAFDKVYINGMFSKVYSIFPLIATRMLKQPVIVAPRGMLAPGALSIKKRKKSSFLRLFKTLKLYKGTTFHSTHEHESAHIKSKISKKSRIVTLPNFPRQPKRKSGTIQKSTGQLNMIMIARIAPEKNILFALQVLTLLPKSAWVSLMIIGPVYDEDYFVRCREIEASLPANVHVVWGGSKTYAQIDDALDESHLFFLPTLGENYGHSIAEAMLSGVPVLITDTTPWRNLKSRGLGADLALDNHQAFADFITAVASMNQSDYADAFGKVAASASELIHLPLTIEGYKLLFE